jgi:hypothetical protein
LILHNASGYKGVEEYLQSGHHEKLNYCRYWVVVAMKTMALSLRECLIIIIRQEKKFKREKEEEIINLIGN